MYEPLRQRKCPRDLLLEELLLVLDLEDELLEDDEETEQLSLIQRWIPSPTSKMALLVSVGLLVANAMMHNRKNNLNNQTGDHSDINKIYLEMQQMLSPNVTYRQPSTSTFEGNQRPDPGRFNQYSSPDQAYNPYQPANPGYLFSNQNPYSQPNQPYQPQNQVNQPSYLGNQPSYQPTTSNQLQQPTLQLNSNNKPQNQQFQPAQSIQYVQAVPYTPNVLSGVFSDIGQPKATNTNPKIQYTQVPSYVTSQPAEVIKPVQKQEVKTMHEVHHYERPLQVVTIDDMESKWKSKCLHLEYVVYELQVEIQKLRQNSGNGTVQIVQDDKRINELQLLNKQLKDRENELKNENKRLNEDLDEWKNRYKKLEDIYTKSSSNDEQLRQLKIQLNDLQNELDEQDSRLKAKDAEILSMRDLLNRREQELNDAYNQLNDLEARLESVSQTETTLITLQGEIEVWKKKFRDKNSEAADLSEKLTMAETELEALKKKQVTVQKEQVITKTTTNNSSSGLRGSNYKPSGIYEKKQL